MNRVLLFAALALLAAGPAQAQTFRDTMAVEFTQHVRVVDEGGFCTVYALTSGTHPDPRGNGLDGNYHYSGTWRGMPRTYYYDNDVPAWTGVPPDSPGNFITYTVGVSSSGGATCDNSYYIIGASAGFMAQVRQFADYSTPGQPVADYEWDQTGGLSVAFDGSASYVATEQGHRPVASYAWTFGDGGTSTAAAPTHAYAATGDYAVTLTVRDAHARADTYTETVEVVSPLLSARARVVEPEAGQGDTLTVVGTVENASEGEVRNVEAHAMFALQFHFPDSLLTAAVVDPVLRRLPEADPPPTTQASLAPGDTLQVRRRYVVETLGQYRLVPTDPLRDVAVRAEAALVRVEGEDASGDPVRVIRPCAGVPPGLARGGPPPTCERNYADILPTVAAMVVNSTDDDADDDAGDDACDTGQLVMVEGEMVAECTLRAAIEETNAVSGRQDIAFGIPGEGVRRIEPASPLPTITDAVALDGTTQPGYAAYPVVYLDGRSAGGGDGLRLAASNSLIRGFAVFGFAGHGVLVEGGTGNRIEAVISGSDADGTAGIGNGGDGIRVDGAAQITIGNDDAPAVRGRAGGNEFDFDVAVVGNAGNGIFLNDPANAAAVRARRAAYPRGGSPASDDLDRRMGGGIFRTLTGMLPNVLGQVLRLPNGESGISVAGALGLALGNLAVGPSGRFGLDIEASQDILFRSGSFGKLRPVIQSALDIAGSGQSGVRIAESIDVTVGSDDAAEDPIEAIASGGWMMEVERSERVQVRGVFGGVTATMDSTTAANIRAAFRNLSGGIRVEDSPDVTIGAMGVPTVLANNGGPGLQVLGQVMERFKLLAAYVGTNLAGLVGIGNAGDGVRIEDGVPGFALGGESEDEAVVSAGNGGHGFSFRNLLAGLVDPRVSRAIVPGLTGRIAEALLQPLPNVLSGIFIENSSDLSFDNVSVGASGRHGVEIMGAESRRLRFLRTAIGKRWGADVMTAADVAGPTMDGFHVEGGSDLEIGDPEATEPSVEIVGAGGFGAYFRDAQGTRMSNVRVGFAQGSAATWSPEAIASLRNTLDGIRAERANRFTLQDSEVANNGTPGMDGGFGLAVEASADVSIRRSGFGIVGALTRLFPNLLGSIRLTALDSILVSSSRLLSGDLESAATNRQAIVARFCTVLMGGNVIEGAGGEGGAGSDGVDIFGGLLEAVRNVIRDSDGDGILLRGGAEGFLRGNTILDNAGFGLRVESAAHRGGGMLAVAPDNWWGHPSGPGGAGPGSGDEVSEGVDYTPWLAGPPGVVVVPDVRTVVLVPGDTTRIPVGFSNLLLADDVLDVTVTDERGWVVGETAYEVAVTGGRAARRVLRVDVPADAATVNVVTIRAVSQADPSAVGEARVVFAAPGVVVPLAENVPAGGQTLPVASAGAFRVGGTILLNPGGANEEEATVVGFGSLLLAAPLRFPHRAGERIAPANRMAVSSEAPAALPGAFSLSAAHPNPFNRSTVLDLDLPEAGQATVTVYDALGRRVAVLLHGALEAGTHTVQFEARGLPSGVYLIRASTEQGTPTRRVTLLR